VIATPPGVVNKLKQLIMQEAINFAIWLKDNTDSSFYLTYTLISTGHLYYTDSQADMEALYNIYLNSNLT
jgi:hypothetical protein